MVLISPCIKKRRKKIEKQKKINYFVRKKINLLYDNYIVSKIYQIIFYLQMKKMAFFRRKNFEKKLIYVRSKFPTVKNRENIQIFSHKFLGM